MKETIDWTTEYPVIDWMGYRWKQDMPGGDKMHPCNPYRYYHPDSTRISNNKLELNVFKNPRFVKRWDGNTYDCKYSCGLVRSEECFSYGTYTLYCILPKGVNLLPAFWLTNEKTWPPEIDIFEGYPNACGGYWTPSIRPHKPLLKQGYAIESNIHYGTAKDRIKAGATGCETKVLFNPSSEVNKYSLEWTSEYIVIRYNNTIVRYVDERTNWPLFKQLNEHPWMYVIFDNVIHKNRLCGLGKPLVLKYFDYRKL